MRRREVEQATTRSEERRLLAEQRAAEARRRAETARAQADGARAKGDARAAASHDHEAAIHARAVDVHLQAASLQQQHARELAGADTRKGVDEDGLRRIMATVRRGRDEAELRSEEARALAIAARERAQQLHLRRQPGAGDA